MSRCVSKLRQDTSLLASRRGVGVVVAARGLECCVVAKEYPKHVQACFIMVSAVSPAANLNQPAPGEDPTMEVRAQRRVDKRTPEKKIKREDKIENVGLKTHSFTFDILKIYQPRGSWLQNSPLPIPLLLLLPQSMDRYISRSDKPHSLI